MEDEVFESQAFKSEQYEKNKKRHNNDVNHILVNGSYVAFGMYKDNEGNESRFCVYKMGHISQFLIHFVSGNMRGTSLIIQNDMTDEYSDFEEIMTNKTVTKRFQIYDVMENRYIDGTWKIIESLYLPIKSKRGGKHRRTRRSKRCKRRSRRSRK